MKQVKEMNHRKTMKMHGIWTMVALVCMIAALTPLPVAVLKILAAAGIVCIILCIYTGHRMLKK